MATVDVTTWKEKEAGGSGGIKRVLVLFALSGAAGLIYEVVWFQLLRLTIGANAQSLGLLLACFMVGLFIGSLTYARIVPARWHPLKTYAVLELGIAAMGLVMPYLIAAIRGSYLAHAGTPQTAMLLRCLICAALLLPPTILMGATLPALARWVKSDEKQAGTIGRLYAINIIGAVVGTLGGALVLLPYLGVVGANLVAVCLNVFVAILAATMRSGYSPVADESSAAAPALAGTLPVFLAYGLNGAASLSFEVIWSRLLSMVFGATVYAFAMVLGVFLLGLGVGGIVGSAWGPRLKNPRRSYGILQLCVAVALSGTALLVPHSAMWFLDFDSAHLADPWLLTMTNFARAFVVVMPGAFLWGMSFPFALVSLGRDLGDAARPVGRLYAFNTVGSVFGSLATSFVLIPWFGSSTATARLMLIPITAAVILLLPKRAPAIAGAVLAGAVLAVTFFTPWPTQLNDLVRAQAPHIADIPDLVYIVGVPLVVAVAMFMSTRVRQWWAFVLVAGSLGLAFLTAIPQQLYMLGRWYPYKPMLREFAEIIAFEEGAMEPVVVFVATDGSMQVAINSKICASTVAQDMTVQRVLGHLPVMLSSDPSETLVVGLGAGVTAGAVSIHDSVKHMDVAELEPRVKKAAAKFAEANYSVMDNPKTNVIVTDGRHHIATTDKRYGVITSDPVAPFLAGSATLYTVEYYQACRDKLIEGGIFTQWMGMAGMDSAGLRSLLAAFAEVYPEGSIWVTPIDVVMVGSTGPVTFDVAELRKKWQANPEMAKSLSEVQLGSVEALLGCYLCSCSSPKFQAFLEGAVVNRDWTLTIQYTGWQAYYKWNMAETQRTFAKLRDYDSAAFVVPEGEREEFMNALRRQQQKYEDEMVDEPTRMKALP
jgi:spermidine synthase